jgi:hypothetical protein
MLAKPAWGAGGFTPLHGTLLEFFSVYRFRLGDFAEEYLKSNGFNG